MSEKIRLHFYGASGTVTGSKFLIEFRNRKILIDCGMFQGLKELRSLNWEHLNVPSEQIDTILLTHGHLDHTGYLPRIVQSGFAGKIHGTLPTLEITEIILNDSARIQEEEAERANKYGYSKHKPAKPLYDLEDVKKTIPHFKAEPLDHWFSLEDDIKCRFRYNGHIIGATYIELDIAGVRFVFSGDIGRESDLLLRHPDYPEEADYIIMESTYGDREHEDENLRVRLAEIITKTVDRAGTLIIPSFAVERAQVLMFLLWKMRLANEIPDVPIYVDSPMSDRVLEVFKKYKSWHKMSEEDCGKMCEVVSQLRSLQSTYAVIDDYHPKIVIAGSGMITGGRVLRYLEKYLGDEMSTVLLPGFQAEGTRGRDLAEGKKQIRISGKEYSVKAEIQMLDGLSAHADQSELVHWLSALKKKPQKVFIIHGEPKASIALKSILETNLQLNCQIPKLYDMVELEIPKTD